LVFTLSVEIRSHSLFCHNNSGAEVCPLSVEIHRIKEKASDSLIHHVDGLIPRDLSRGSAVQEGRSDTGERFPQIWSGEVGLSSLG
jgi:hypothetical protein